MPITDKEAWKKWVDANKDGYGGCCIRVARKVMEFLDDDKHKEFGADGIVHEANKSVDAGITGFMAGCVAEMVSTCHSRGEEFRKKWNTANQIGTEGDEANKGKSILNSALMSIDDKKEVIISE